MRTWMKPVGCLLLLAVVAGVGGGCGSSSGTTPLQVMLLHAWPDGAADGMMGPSRVEDVEARFEALGLDVTPFDGRAGTPTLAQLALYDAVLVSSDDSFADGTALGDALADYVDGGGAVVLAVFSTSFGIDGRFDTADYRTIPEAAGLAGDGPITLGTTIAHPILTGVSSVDGGTSSYRADTMSVHAMATLVAEWSDGRPLVATRTDLNARRVDVNLYPPTDDARDDWQSASADGIRLLVNALLWAAGRI